MRPAAPLPHRTRLEYHVWLDTPVGLTPPKVTPDGPERGIVFPAGRSQGTPGPRPDGAQPGWLGLLTIRNQGPAPVPSADFTPLLGLAFPRRQVLAAWVSDTPPAPREHSRTASRTAARAPADTQPDSADQGQPDPAGGFQLRPKDACTVVVILSGTPEAGPRRVRRDGTLADGKVTARSCR